MRRRTSSALAALGLILLLVRCNAPDIWGRTWPCSSDDDCGAGWVCGPEGVCTDPDHLADAPLTGADAEHVTDGVGPADSDGADAGGMDSQDTATPDAAPDAAADVCECTDGPCCERCHFRPALASCEARAATETHCRDGAACGGSVEVRTADRYCSGTSPGCDGELGDWSEWEVADSCDVDQVCGGETPECRMAVECECAARCDDDDACTEESCDGEGWCVHGAVDCDDGDPCTDDGCDADDGCWHAPGGEGEVCAAGDETGRCIEGACCVPACSDRTCGADGCGGQCGTCEEAAACDGRACVPVPRCDDGTCDTDDGEDCRTCPGDCPTQGQAPESCDAVDNDCDGLTDEELEDPLAADCRSAGVCGSGVRAPCISGQWACDYTGVAGHEPAEATCDGLDNDCDGTTDESLPPGAACERHVEGIGTCSGHQTCRGIEGLACDASLPGRETCDGADNDCDGETDEYPIDPEAANCLSNGACSSGVTATCEEGTWRCDYGEVPAYEITEFSCDFADNDCDGDTDEDVCIEHGEQCEADESCNSGSCAADLNGLGTYCASSLSGCVLVSPYGGNTVLFDHEMSYCIDDEYNSYYLCRQGTWSQLQRCEDNDPCTVNHCGSPGGCRFEELSNGWPCETGAGVCIDGGCCAPSCTGRACGPDRCWGACGSCQDGEWCSADGQCFAVPSACELGCPELQGYTSGCNESGHCEYVPDAPLGSGTSPYGALIWVPPSSFSMGSDSEQTERPVHDVAFSAGYFIDKYEATAESYAVFLDSHGGNSCDAYPCANQSEFVGTVHWSDGSANVRQNCAACPATEVTWYGARAFCVWAGGRLCSEAEWERAAEGTTERTYPWGDAVPGAALANCMESRCGDGFNGLAPVGSFPEGASPVGALDLAGNAMEWVEDDWRYVDYGESYWGAPCDGTAWSVYPRVEARVVRGGTYESEPRALRTAARYYRPPVAPWFDIHGDGVGFRCCRSPD